MRRGSLGVKILLGFYYASQSWRVSVICSSQSERLRCSPPPLAVLPPWRHLLIPTSGPEPVPAASFSPLPPTVMAGVLGTSSSRSSERQQEKGILISLLVSGNLKLLSSYEQVASVTCIVLICQKAKLNASLHVVPFLLYLPSKC